MRLAFYYHIPLHHTTQGYFLPSYLGGFLEELARNVDELVLVMHQAVGNEILEADYRLDVGNINFVNLGPKTSAWHRSLFYKSVLKKKLGELESIDAILIRCPSPLAVAFKKLLPQKKIFQMIVGDYAEAADQLKEKTIKNLLLRKYLNFIDKKFLNQLPSTDVFVNSSLLYEKYKTLARSIELIKTTTLREEDFFRKTDKKLNTPVQLLYTGRIEFTKGLTELVKATAELVRMGVFIKLNIVGWEASNEKTYEKYLLKLAQNEGIKQNVIFHGKKQIGEELNSMYRKADIYVIPSYHEGFPRTIWEAMANSLPVIATKVGGIPSYLENETNALLIEAKDVSSITEAVNRLISDNNLRERMIENNLQLVAENTLPKQTLKLITSMAKRINN
ncbi:glycosyltransferase family 4 protein [Sphingobacterium siyangense]|uniref:glycosyltransferase family 4 protein n=1 Tax=Sphingobacterium siyangense TaxID=459529 RepID=UPI002FDEA5E8